MSVEDGSPAIDRAGLDELIGALERRGYTLVGPTVRDRGDRLRRARLGRRPARPAGPTSRRAAPTGSRARDDDALFGYNVGPNSWKSFLFPSALTLWKARRAADGEPRGRPRTPPHPPRYAFIGVRSCDLHAIAVQDRVFIGRRLRRRRLRGAGARARSSSRSTAARPAAPASASRWTPGRKATAGFDLALTELLDGRRAPLPRRGRQRARRRGARPSSRTARPRPHELDGGRAQVDRARRRRADGPRDRHRRHQGAALPQPRAPALGRGRRALPDLRQLHDGLPDLLLPHRRGRHRPRRRGGRARARAGTRASRSTTPTSTAAASARSTRRATASG